MKRLKENEEKNQRFYGCAYKGILAEWHPTEKLLREIAKKLDRDYDKDMTNKLRESLILATATYHKEIGY